jgi:hypothetical protein
LCRSSIRFGCNIPPLPFFFMTWRNARHLYKEANEASGAKVIQIARGYFLSFSDFSILATAAHIIHRNYYCSACLVISPTPHGRVVVLSCLVKNLLTHNTSTTTTTTDVPRSCFPLSLHGAAHPTDAVEISNIDVYTPTYIIHNSPCWKKERKS